jgi:hypothetical protein
MLSACLCIPHINFWMPEPIFIKLGMYIMAPEPISTPYFKNPRFSLCVCMCIPLSLLGKGSVNTFPRQEIHETIEERLDACVCVWIPLSLLSNNSVKKFPRQRRIVGGVVFYAVLVASKESGRSVLPITSCLYYSDEQLRHKGPCCVTMRGQCVTNGSRQSE